MNQGSGCGSVGRAVASDPRGPRFKSRHRQIFIEHLFSVNFIVMKRQKIKERGQEWPFLKKRKVVFVILDPSHRATIRSYSILFIASFCLHFLFPFSRVCFCQCDQMLEQKVAKCIPKGHNK